MSFVSEEWADVPEAYTPRDLTFHIVGILDISTSKLSQRDRWNEIDDPQRASADRIRNGHQIIREIRDEDAVPAVGSAPLASAYNSTNACYKLTLRDQSNNLCFAYEQNTKLPFLRPAGQARDTPLPIPLGGRLVVSKGTLIRYGALMLKGNQCDYKGTLSVQDSEFATQLNSGIAKKHIEYLNQELNQR